MGEGRPEFLGDLRGSWFSTCLKGKHNILGMEEGDHYSCERGLYFLRGEGIFSVGKQRGNMSRPTQSVSHALNFYISLILNLTNL